MLLLAKHLSLQKGVTLIELVLSMVIIAISLTGVLLTINLVVVDSSDPLLRQQAIYLAQAQMNQILDLPFLDPVTKQACPSPTSGVMNYVCAYNGYSAVPTAKWWQFNSQMSSFTTCVQVAPTAFQGIPAADALQVNVTVTYNGINCANCSTNSTKCGANSAVQLVAYRINY